MNSIVPILLLLTLAPQNDSVRVEPSFGVAGNFGTWTVTYEVGASGMRSGGCVRVQLPDTWHAGERNSRTVFKQPIRRPITMFPLGLLGRTFSSRRQSNRNRTTIS